MTDIHAPSDLEIQTGSNPEAISTGAGAASPNPDQANSWWKSAVVYQVYPRSFADGNGDGFGDIRGLINKIPHLVRLGVDVVWLSPAYKSPQADAGYDISDYQDIDPLFGTLDDIDELIAKLHEADIKLLMDLVVNHTSDEHPWFVESRSSLDNPKRDWYWWRDPRQEGPENPEHTEGAESSGRVENSGRVDGQAKDLAALAKDPAQTPPPGSEPTNWESFFSGPTWTFDQTTGQYYLHLFASKQPDLNWENPEVRHAVYEMMRWWLDRGVDGFRMDVINLISKYTDLPDAVPDPITGRGDGSPFYTNGPKLHDYLQEMTREVFESRAGILTVGEMPGVTVAEAALVTAPERNELNMVFQFEHVGLDHGRDKFDVKPLAPGALADNFTKWQEGLAGQGWNSLYLSNHDQPRPVSRFGDDGQFWRESATALGTILHLQQGTPYIYQGEEIGMTNSQFNTMSDFRDVETLNYWAQAQENGLDLDAVLHGLRTMGRDNARTPVQWTGGRYAGFSESEPWIAVNPNHTWLNAEAQYEDPNSVFNHYRALIALRKSSQAVALGSFARIDAGHPAIFAFTRTYGEARIFVVANLSSEPVPVSPQLVPDGAALLLTNYQPSSSAPTSGNTPDPAPEPVPVTSGTPAATGVAAGQLRPWEALVFESPAA